MRNSNHLIKLKGLILRITTLQIYGLNMFNRNCVQKNRVKTQKK